MKIAQSFIVQLKKRDDRFVNLRMRTAAVEFTILGDGGTSCERDNEIMIHIQMRQPCAHAKAKEPFGELVENMELAGYSCKFGPSELYRPELDTAHYILSFIRKESGGTS